MNFNEATEEARKAADLVGSPYSVVKYGNSEEHFVVMVHDRTPHEIRNTVLTVHPTLSVSKDFKPEIPGSMLEILKLTYRDLRMIHTSIIHVGQHAKEQGQQDIAQAFSDLAARFGPLFDLIGPVKPENT